MNFTGDVDMRDNEAIEAVGEAGSSDDADDESDGDDREGGRGSGGGEREPFPGEWTGKG